MATGKEGGNLSGRKTQSWAQALWTWDRRVKAAGSRPAPGPQGAGCFPAPPAGWRRGGAGGGARPAHALEAQDAPALRRRRSPAEGGPPLLTGPHRGRGHGISPAGLAPGLISKRRPPESSRLRAPGPAARWPLALPWRVGPEGTKVSSVLTVLSSLLHPQSPSYSRHSVSA